MYRKRLNHLILKDGSVRLTVSVPEYYLNDSGEKQAKIVSKSYNSNKNNDVVTWFAQRFKTLKPENLLRTFRS
jgi:hypothetical protein